MLYLDNDSQYAWVQQPCLIVLLAVFPFRSGILGTKIPFIVLTSLGVMGLFFNWFCCDTSSSCFLPR